MSHDIVYIHGREADGGEIVGAYHLTCILGSVFLHRMVLDPFTDRARFDWEALRSAVHLGQRFLDNIIENCNLPTPEHFRELKLKRKRGLGFLGLGSAMAMLGMRYGDPDSVEFARRVQYEIAYTSYVAGVRLAIDRGPCELLEGAENREKFLSSKFLTEDLIPAIEQYDGREVADDLVSGIRKYGCRFTHCLAVAPTGTMSIVNGYPSSGIEPPFDFRGVRNVIVPGKKTKEQFDCLDYAFLEYVRHKHKEETGKDFESVEELEAAAVAFDLETLPGQFVKATEIGIDAHLAVMAAVSQLVDQSVSKTVNLGPETTFEEFKGVYAEAYRLGLKGCTTYRPNPDKISAVLVDREVMEQTVYEFVDSDGFRHRVRGSETVFHDGAEHVAMNLHDAIVDGSYGAHVSK